MKNYMSQKIENKKDKKKKEGKLKLQLLPCTNLPAQKELREETQNYSCTIEVDRKIKKRIVAQLSRKNRSTIEGKKIHKKTCT